jgi:hypothetical protein
MFQTFIQLWIFRCYKLASKSNFWAESENSRLCSSQSFIESKIHQTEAEKAEMNLIINDLLKQSQVSEMKKLPELFFNLNRKTIQDPEFWRKNRILHELQSCFSKCLEVNIPNLIKQIQRQNHNRFKQLNQWGNKSQDVIRYSKNIKKKLNHIENVLPEQFNQMKSFEDVCSHHINSKNPISFVFSIF